MIDYEKEVLKVYPNAKIEISQNDPSGMVFSNISVEGKVYKTNTCHAGTAWELFYNSIVLRGLINQN